MLMFVLPVANSAYCCMAPMRYIADDLSVMVWPGRRVLSLPRSTSTLLPTVIQYGSIEKG